ncbi:hypothetical protein KSC_016680 [Ktedonobacter sp. SOSP1-52]|uniref:hypothetical protein n=1 Tax=Ktedonobacter sp. SOSP1-52 TaxID=2778366 RepID=UPI0019165B18|nr:hypothetical protein [Ktedonobacter sp. SOSP1-52]GHO62776.1 hypothetical protein KSC_016680 [Ktedonobacter sp. SOSP1-52]
MPQEKIHLHGYEITATVLRGPYSTLYRGMAQDTQQPIFIRNWPTAQITSERKRQRLQDEVDKLKLLNEHPHILDTYTVTIPQGSMNQIFPGQYNGGQPTVFNPGRQYHVFRVTFYNGDIVMWMLNNKTRTASQNGPGC